MRCSCKRSSPLLIAPRLDRIEQMIISHSHRFVFIHVHKTAGESVSAALAPTLTRDDLLIEGDPRTIIRRKLATRYRAAHGLDKHSPASNVRDFLGPRTWDSLYSFAVVREPIRRAVSLYTYLVMIRERLMGSRLRRVWYRTPLGRPSDPSLWLGMRALNATTNFSEFIHHPDALADPGFQAQSRMIHDAHGNSLVTRVLKLESLVDDFRAAQHDIGITPPVELPRRNGSAPLAPRITVTEDDAVHLRTQFASDYDAFDYPTS